MSEKVRLTQKQRAAVLALLTCPTVEEAAARAGCSSKSITRWMRDPVFAEALSQAEREAIGQATRRLCGLADAAVNTLKGIMNDVDGASPASRTRAAVCVLESLLKLRSAVDLEERLTAMEARLQ